MLNACVSSARRFLLVAVSVCMPAAAVAGTFTVSTTSITGGVDGVAYTAQLNSVNGTGTVKWALASGSMLVAGLNLDSTGKVSGTPTASTNGPGNFKVVATDSATPTPHTANGTINYIINPENGSFRITSTSFINPTVGTAYSTSVTSSGGIGTVTYKLINSTALSPGLSLATTGKISGTPTAAGLTNFWVQATDSSMPTAKTVNAYLGILVNASLIKVTTSSLTGATAETAYSTTLLASGGKSPYTWSLVSGTSFDGLKLSSAGVLSGTPLLPSTATANNSFQVKVSDSSSLADFATIKIAIAPGPLKVTTASPLPEAEQNIKYSKTLAASGGVMPYTWSISGTPQPPTGITLNQTSGVLSGTPTTAQTSTFTVQVKDSQGKTATAPMSLTVASSLAFSNQTLPEGVAGTAYSHQLTASKGITPYNWSLLSAQPPPGLNLSSAGVLSGTPQQMSGGPWNFGVRVTDAAGGTGTISVSITIVNPLMVSNNLPPAYVNSNYQAMLGASGGTQPYTFAVTGLPAGLTYTAAGAISGKPTTANPSATIGVTVTDSSTPKLKTTATVDLPVLSAVAKCTPTTSSAKTLAELNGGYAFHLAQIYMAFDNANVFSIGEFTADGMGNITGGQFDANGPRLSAVGHQTFSGTYSIGTDGRGEMNVSIPTASGPSVQRSFCIAVDSLNVSGVAGGAQIIEDDASDIVANGRIFAQGGSNFTEESAKGSWAFGLQGAKASGPYELRRAVTGYVTMDGAGNVTKGEFDSNGDQIDQSTGTVTNEYNGPVAITGTYTLASSGRGTMTLTSSDGGADLIFYIAGPNQFLALTSQPGAAPGNNQDVMVGRGLMRTASTFTDATLKGTSVFIENGVKINGASYGPKTGVGLFTWNGTGGVSGSEDVNSAGTVKLAPSNTISGTYTVDSGGRAVLTISSNSGNQVVFYLIGTNAGFGLVSNTAVSSLEMENQEPPTGGFKATSIAGPFSEGSKWYSYLPQVTYSGEFTVDSAATTFKATVDTDLAGAIDPAVLEDFEYAAASNGRFTVNYVIPGSSTPQYMMYFVTPKKAYAVDITSNPWAVLTEINSQ